MTEALNDDAKAIAAKATGLREDQIERAVVAYRAAAVDLHQEPEWRALAHYSGQNWGAAQYADSSGNTLVRMEIHSHKVRGEWVQEKTFSVHDMAYETYGEARAAELKAITRPQPYEVTP